MNKTMLCAALTAAALAFTGPAKAEVSYAGKSITLYVGFGPGGGYDAYTRLMGRHIGNHIPGNPRVVVQNKPGGGSSAAASYIYGPARQDGTELGVFNSQLALNKVLGEKAAYDVTNFSYLGRLVRALNIALVRADAPATTVEAAKKAEIVIAASGPNSATTRIPMAFNRMLGTKFKVLRGYESSPKMLLAIEQGEVHALGGTSMTVVERSIKKQVAEGKMKYLWIVGLDRHPGLPGVPTAPELLSDPEQRQIMELLCSSSSFGYALWGPPKLAADRLTALRAAFNAMVKDPAFLADAKKRRLDLEPETGQYLDGVMQRLAKAPADIVRKADALSKP
jgi:tripartite-type tricarboxylate transporter receptor subunit TctC